MFEEIGRSVELVLADLARFGGPNEVTRARVRALAGQLEASERGGVFAWDREVEREAKILSPLLAAYIESLTVGGAA